MKIAASVVGSNTTFSGGIVWVTDIGTGVDWAFKTLVRRLESAIVKLRARSSTRHLDVSTEHWISICSDSSSISVGPGRQQSKSIARRRRKQCLVSSLQTTMRTTSKTEKRDELAQHPKKLITEICVCLFSRTQTLPRNLIKRFQMT